MSSAQSLTDGVLQQFRPQTTTEGAGFLITDQIHGEHFITEPLLVELLKSPPIRRLQGIHQHGITGLLGIIPPVTRLEHSVGAMLVVRRAGGSLTEQAFGLMHDVSHTTLSHVVDWALSEPGEDSYHEIQMHRYVASTALPDILAAHGLHLPDCLEEANFPLVEQPSPHLCADRLDYAMRDAVACGKLILGDAQRISASLVSVPGPRSPRRLLALVDRNIALTLARAYLAMDRDVWSNPAHIDLYRRTGEIIRDAVSKGKIATTTLWELSDVDFWKKLWDVADEEQRRSMTNMKDAGLRSDVSTLPAATKVRTIDPDVCEANSVEPVPLSALCGEYSLERQEYILSRKAILHS